MCFPPQPCTCGAVAFHVGWHIYRPSQLRIGWGSSCLLVVLTSIFIFSTLWGIILYLAAFTSQLSRMCWSHNSWRASDDVHQQSNALAQKLVHSARAREHLRGFCLSCMWAIKISRIAKKLTPSKGACAEVVGGQQSMPESTASVRIIVIVPWMT